MIVSIIIIGEKSMELTYIAYYSLFICFGLLSAVLIFSFLSHKIKSKKENFSVFENQDKSSLPEKKPLLITDYTGSSQIEAMDFPNDIIYNEMDEKPFDLEYDPEHDFMEENIYLQHNEENPFIRSTIDDRISFLSPAAFTEKEPVYSMQRENTKNNNSYIKKARLSDELIYAFYSDLP